MEEAAHEPQNGRDVARDADERFVVAHTAVASPALVTELRLWLASDVTPLWFATEAWLRARQISPPFWAFAWAGGQGLARFILDRPELVVGARVLDFACGSGLVGLAAKRAGAASVCAVDIDRVAIAATRCNARLNALEIDASARDRVGDLLDDIDVVLAGDIFYDAAMTAHVLPWLRAAAARGTPVFVGDPHRDYAPRDAREGVEEVARYDVPGVSAVESCDVRATRVLRLR